MRKTKYIVFLNIDGSTDLFWTTPHTVHTTLYTLRFTLHAAHSTLYTLHWTLYSSLAAARLAFHAPDFTPHTLHSTPHTLHFALDTSYSTLDTLRATHHTLHSTLTLRTLHFKLYTWHSTLPHLTPFTLRAPLLPNSYLKGPHSTLPAHVPKSPLYPTLHTLHSTHYNPAATLHTAHFTHYTLHSTLYTHTAHSELYTLHLTLYSLPAAYLALHAPYLTPPHSTLTHHTLHCKIPLLALQLPTHRPPRPKTPSRPLCFFLPFPLFFHYAFTFFHCSVLLWLHFCILLPSNPPTPNALQRTDQGGSNPTVTQLPPGT